MSALRPDGRRAARSGTGSNCFEIGSTTIVVGRVKLPLLRCREAESASCGTRGGTGNVLLFGFRWRIDGSAAISLGSGS